MKDSSQAIGEKEISNLERRLDVGCGGNARYGFGNGVADVYCDVLKLTIRIRDFVQCDVQHLPFRSQSFTEVYAQRS